MVLRLELYMVQVAGSPSVEFMFPAKTTNQK
jgi:hypothetical protein